MSMESDLKFLILQIGLLVTEDGVSERVMPKFTSLFIQIISLVSSMDLESQPKPDSEFISLMKQLISLGSSRSNSEPECEIISKVISGLSCINSNSDLKQEPEPELISIVTEIVDHFTEMSIVSDSQLGSLIGQILTLAVFGSLGSLISLSPQLEVEIKEEKFRVRREVKRESQEVRDCDMYTLNTLNVLSLTREVPTHFHCENCNGEKHKECYKAPVEVKHHLHPKHFLQLVMSKSYDATRECYCCDEDLKEIFYYCSACDFAMNIACVEKPPALPKDYPKWHEHALAPFSRLTSLTCDVCALNHSRCPFLLCLPCGFVVHQKCVNLPRVIRISRHPHRISFTPSFDKGDWSCGVCRRNIDNDYGGYSCFKKDCSYAVHSRCATQSNVWDGLDLDGLPEETEEEVPEPFVTISDGIIQHFSHPHPLRLEESDDRDYDESKQCQACITPIYFGNIYSCTQCDFILHEKCANLSRKLHHPIHPHMLSIVEGYDDVVDYRRNWCSACRTMCTNGFFYKCGKEECGGFKLHVQCATISEPLVHESHMHPLFLTSKPGEERRCGVCKREWLETFNCIDEKCNFALCFKCATLPNKVRYKHDKHLLTLTYGEKTSTMEYWCETCEKKINPKMRFYWCDDGCCVTIHTECLIGKDLYMKPNTSFFHMGKELDVRPNSVTTRPICSHCKKRCPHTIVFQYSESTTCSTDCVWFIS